MRITLKILGGGTFLVNVNPSDTLGQLKEKIQYSTGVSPENQRVLLEQELLDDSSSMLSEYGVFENTELIVLLKQIQAEKVVVKTLRGDVSLQLSVTPDDSIKKIKQLVEEQAGIPSSQQRLIYQATRLMNGSTIRGCKIPNGATIHLVRVQAK